MVVNFRDFNEWSLRQYPPQKRGRGNPGHSCGKSLRYKDVITAFDIETTRLPDIEQSFMYIWQWQIGTTTVIGRTWDDFKEFVEQIRPHVEGKKQKLLVFVHNLSYEFQFLSGIYDFKPEEVFCIEPRKILKCEMYGFLEFRCSYLHSNMNLESYTKKMGVKHAKLSGTFDYDKIRFPWTPLTDEELAYCVHDVKGLVEALQIDMKMEGDSFYTFPLTSTGYVRRDAKRAMKKIQHNYVRDILPNKHIYEMCREAFRGGNTHANRHYAGRVIPDVKSADRSSSYPDVQCNCLFPIKPFTELGAVDHNYVADLIWRRGKAVLMRIALHDVRLHDDLWGCPYIPRDKCRRLQGGAFDNGRVLSADYLEITVTDVDFKIIMDEYDFDGFESLDVAFSTYGKLPQPLIDCTIEYYRDKTELKGVAGQELFYTKQKNKLNSIYGMMAQDPVKDSIMYTDGDFIPEGKQVDTLLEEYNRRGFLAYQWGVWVTAWARLRLEEGLRIAGAERFIYCDTDSVKYVGDVDWSEYNEARKADSIKSGAFATDPAGVTHYMGVYEYEGSSEKFITLGAKKYCSQKHGKLEATIAGVNKKEGGPELERAGGLTAFRPGFVFVDAGGTEAVYNDEPYGIYEAEGREIFITKNVVIRPSTYTLGITGDYMRLIEKSTLDIY